MQHTPAIPSFVSTLFGLVFTPTPTLKRLMASEGMPHVGALLATLLAAIFLPILVQIFSWDFLETQMLGVVGLIGVLFLTGFLFLQIETAIISRFYRPVTKSSIFSLMVYGCVPLIFIVLIFYGVNLATFHRLSIVTYVITGVENANDSTVQYFPYAQVIGHIYFLYIFFVGVATLCELEVVDAAILTISSAIPFYVSFAISLLIAEAIAPGMVQALKHLALAVFSGM